jgi:predicted phosphodiesterase
MSIKSLFLVLSDLHFGRDLHLAPELPPLQITRTAKWFSKEKDIQRFVEQNCGGHSLACVSMLPYYLKTLLNEANREGFDNDNFDLCILLGDQATVPDPHAYKFLAEYLTQSRYETAEGLACAGLNFRREQIIAIPGNHDKLLRQNLNIYQAEFSARLGIPWINPGGSLLVTRLIGNDEYLFLLVDASVYSPDELVVDKGCRDHMARGKIPPTLRQEIVDKLTAIANGRPVDLAMPTSGYERAIKIMLVHYAVDIQRLPRQKQWEERFLPHDCKGLDELVSELRAKFQFGPVLHGHMHVPYLYNHDGAQVVSATTTCERGGPNGFFVIKMLDTGEIRTEHHLWNGLRFAPDPDTSLSKSIEVYPTGAAA